MLILTRVNTGLWACTRGKWCQEGLNLEGEGLAQGSLKVPLEEKVYIKAIWEPESSKGKLPFKFSASEKDEVF